ncbi:MAG: hypothetical protein JW959_10965 [Pirellulales bacterium]|nr:hypothetical protein [Pirellulales bacterium]
MPQPDTANNHHCRRRAAELSPDNAVPLWDGNLYCERCVEFQAPALAD